VGDDVPIDSETFLVIDFMNLKIKLTQPFRDTHRDRVYVCIHRSAYSYISICVFTMFLKK
jgi:enoyl-[acyl-carrier-protein] reductase (NADH)